MDWEPVIFPASLGYDKAPLEDILELTFPVDPNLKPKVSEQVQPPLRSFLFR